MGHEVVQDPQAFGLIDARTLVYAIHCYVDVYAQVAGYTVEQREGEEMNEEGAEQQQQQQQNDSMTSKAEYPAVLIGTDVDHFGRFDRYVLLDLYSDELN